MADQRTRVMSEPPVRPTPRAAPTLASGLGPGRPSAVHRALREPGRPIEPAARALLAHRFGRSLDAVRVHEGPRAASAAERTGAEAFTVGDDIVFAPGRYQPGSPAGLELLAHEVAHTVQQQGAGPASIQHRLVSSAPASTLEREADAAARFVVSGPAVGGGAASLLHARAPGAMLSRRAIAWEKMPGGAITLDDGQTVDEWEPASKQVARFKIPTLKLPREKGPVLDAYRAAVKGAGDGASALEGTVQFDGNKARSGLWESRATTPQLNRNWLMKVGWEDKEANAKWLAAGGKQGTGFPTANPGVAASTCDMDHILELQLGGSNSPSNITPLNSAENQKSGRDIWTAISGMARSLRPAVPQTAGTVDVILSFQDVAQIGGEVPKPTGCAGPGSPGCTCSAVDACAMSQVAAASSATGAGAREVYKVKAGGLSSQFRVPPGDAPVTLLDPNDKESTANTEVIPGMILETLERPKGKGHVITAFIESKPYFKRAKNTRLPITLKQGQDEVKLDAVPEDDGRRLQLRGKNPAVAFTYPYLSAGSLNLELGPNGLEGNGTLTPSVPMLRNAPLKVHLGNGSFDGTLEPDKSKLKLPIPGFQVTRAALKVALAPELAVTGDLDFEVGKVLTGNLHAEPSMAGLAMKGTVAAKIPKLESATGEVTYRDNELTGSLRIKSEQLANLPGKPQGELTVGLTANGLTADGHLTLTLPNGKPLDLDAKRADAAHILLTGRTRFDLPGLHPLDLTVSYDGEHFSASGKTGVDHKGLSGDLTVTYWDGKFSGEVEAKLKVGRVDGIVHLHLDHDASLYGDGKVRVQITKDLAGSVAVKKPKGGGEIEVFGELELPPSILLFPVKSVDKTLFDRVFNIPVFGPIAVQINPSVGFGAGIGPGTIDRAKVGAGLKPFASDADFELSASAQLSIPAYAQLSVGIGLGVALTAGVGSIGGGVKVTGTLRLDGGVFVPFELHYKNGVFTAHAEVIVKGDVSVLVGVQGYLLAEVAGFELWHPIWNLWDKKFDTGLGFKLIIPFDYASDKAFELPSRNQMTIEPDISLDSIQRALMNAVGALT